MKQHPSKVSCNVSSAGKVLKKTNFATDKQDCKFLLTSRTEMSLGPRRCPVSGSGIYAALLEKSWQDILKEVKKKRKGKKTHKKWGNLALPLPWDYSRWIMHLVTLHSTSPFPLVENKATCKKRNSLRKIFVLSHGALFEKKIMFGSTAIW